MFCEEVPESEVLSGQRGDEKETLLSFSRASYHRDAGASTSAGDGDSKNAIDLSSLKIEKNQASPSGNDRSVSKNKASETDAEAERDSELRQAVEQRNLAEVRRLLAQGVTLTRKKNGYTALHSCIVSYSWTASLTECQEELKIINELLAVAKKKDVLDMTNDDNLTPLCSAIMSGHLPIVKALMDAGARTENINGSGETALNIAAHFPHTGHVLEYLLNNRNMKITANDSGLTPIHNAAKSGVKKNMMLLLDKIEDEDEKHELINSVNEDGRTAVNFAASNGHVDMTLLLLRNGAALSVEGEKNTAVQDIEEEFGDPLTFFESLFDESISLTEDTVNVNYKVLAHKGCSQIRVLDDLVNLGFRKILNHPMIESLICLKWKCIQRLIYISIFFFVVFLVLFNIFVITTFHKIDTVNKNYTTHTECKNETSVIPENNKDKLRSADNVVCDRNYWWYPVLYIGIIVLFAQECMWMHLQSRRYFKRPESYVTLGALLLAFCVTLIVECSGAVGRRHVACAALVLLWLRPLFLLSSIRGWGVYILMFWTVALNISKIFLMLGWLVIGFAICFMIQYQLESPFNNFWDASIKSLVMMSSEFDYEDLFGEEHAVKNADVVTAVVVRILFVAFVIFIATILMNLMIGVAVSDINELAAVSHIKALETQVKCLSNLEGVENILSCKFFKKLSYIKYHDSMCCDLDVPDKIWHVTGIGKHWYLEVLDLKVQNAIYDLAKKGKQSSSNPDVMSNHTDSYESITSFEERIKTIINVSEELKEAQKEIKQLLKNLKRKRNRNKFKILKCYSRLQKRGNVLQTESISL